MGRQWFGENMKLPWILKHHVQESTQIIRPSYIDQQSDAPNPDSEFVNYPIKDCTAFTHNRTGCWGLPFLYIYASILNTIYNCLGFSKICVFRSFFLIYFGRCFIYQLIYIFSCKITNLICYCLILLVFKLRSRFMFINNL